MDVGSHLSRQVFTLCIFPILQNITSLIRVIELKRLLQMKDGLVPNFAVRISVDGKYLALRILSTREKGFCTTQQICLAKKALLKA